MKGEKQPYNHKGMLGKHHSKKTKKLISLKNRGRKHTKEEKQKMRLAKLGKPHYQSLETKRKIGIAQIGKKLSEETKQKISLAHKGKKLSKGQRLKISLKNKGRLVSRETREKISKANTGRKNTWSRFPILTGKDNPMWKGGITPINQKIRKSLKYKLWREAIFKRDDYTCQICGGRGSMNLRANHIKKFADYPELRFIENNGITICRKCDERWVLNREPDWESYFNFNLETRNLWKE